MLTTMEGKTETEEEADRRIAEEFIEAAGQRTEAAFYGNMLLNYGRVRSKRIAKLAHAILEDQILEIIRRARADGA